MVWGAILGLLASQVIGMIWYSPYFLGTPWMKGVFPGKKQSDLSPTQSAFLISIVAHGCLVILLSYIMSTYIAVKTVMAAIKLSLGLAAFLTVVDIPHCVFQKRSVTVFIIDHLFDAAVMAVQSSLVVYFS